MAELNELKARLAQMLMDPYKLSLGEGVLEEALRRALGEVNALMEAPVSIGGLDGAATGSVPGYAMQALLQTAEGFALSSGLAGRLLAFDGSLAGGPALLAHCEAKLDEAEAALERLRLFVLQNSPASACFAWPWADC